MEIQNSFVHKLADFSRMLTILLKLVLKVMPDYETTASKKTIFVNSMRILEFLITGKKSKLSDENILRVNSILLQAKPENYTFVLPFIAALISEQTHQNIFESLTDYDVKVRKTMQTPFEAILVNTPNLLDNLYEMSKDNLKILEDTSHMSGEKEFALYMKDKLESKRLQKSGMWIRELEISSFEPPFVIVRLKEIYRHFKLHQKYNMLNYMLEIGVLNEALFIFYTLLYGKRRIFIKKLFHRLKFIETFMSPFFDLIFDEQIDYHLQSYVRFE